MRSKTTQILVGALVLSTLATPIHAEGLSGKYNQKVQKEIPASTPIFREENNASIKDIPVISITNITDISNHWGKESIDYLVQKGGISGYPDGTFKPNGTITYAEFLKIALYSVSAPKSQADPSHWASGAFQDAERLLVFKAHEAPQSEWDKPISRYEMTRIMTRIAEEVLGESKTATTGIANIMPDYNKVMGQQSYKHYVEQAYMKGLIAGQSGGVFNGDSNGTRAEAATMIVRIIDKAKRVAVDTSKPVAGVGTILNSNDPNRGNAKVGDTFIKPDGTKVVLAVGPSGVLGEGQNVAVDLGRKFPNGKLLKNGDLGTQAMGHPGEKYSIDLITGEGHFKNDWLKIANRYIIEARKIQNPKEGQKVGPWVVFYEGDWAWDGPSF